MKRILAGLPLLVLMFWGCNANNGSGSPKDVLTKFFKSLSEKNIQETKKYVTEDSEGMINLMQMSIKNIAAPEEGDQFNPEKITIGDPEINGEEAQVPVTEKTTGETVHFFLKKEKGNWKVAFDMATLARMAKQKMEKDGINAENLDSFLQELTDEGKDFNEHLDSVTEHFKGVTEDDLKKAKDFLEKNPEFKKEQIDKITEELKKLQNQNP